MDSKQWTMNSGQRSVDSEASESTSHASRFTLHVSRFTLHEKLYLIALVLFAFGLRVWQLEAVPPGWRDDELINSLVISQKVLDGDLAFYYPDASGHEALYHALNAIMLGLFGANAIGIRLLSAFFGVLGVLLTYRLGKRFFGAPVGWIASLALACSFWSLMYSRIGLRHISLPVFALAAYYFFWQGLKKSSIVNGQLSMVNFLLSALFMGVGFYTYFASRGVPLILLVFSVYLAIVAPGLFRRRRRGILFTFGVTALLALPLAITLSRQPESEARVAELAVPIVEAQAGNFEPLREYVVTTLSMFHSRGDDEWLYNIPDRPVFNLFGALFLWLGVAIAFWYAFSPLLSRFTFYVLRGQKRPLPDTSTFSLACALLFAWWFAGIIPAFISVPPASLGHTILAQPATFILAALPVGLLKMKDWRLMIGDFNLQSLILFLLGSLLVAGVAWRDLPDYFSEWPQRGMVRFLYRADIRDVAQVVNAHPEMTDFGITSVLPGPWDRVALEIDLRRKTAVRPRWYNPERALLLQPAVSFTGFPQAHPVYAGALEPAPGGIQAGFYTLTQVLTSPTEEEAPVCFENGLCLARAVYEPQTAELELAWWVERPLRLPPMPLISNPPPPGVYAGPRLSVFVHLVDAAGNLLAGDDGLWVDPVTLHPGDRFLQRHWPQASGDAAPAALQFGLYDPMTGARILTTDGRDFLRLEIED